MEITGRWIKDEEGYMDFDNPQIQRLYEVITDQYYQIIEQYVNDHDEEYAALKARERGYFMITDYKEINGKEEFATTYITPAYTMDLWYDTNPETGKREYKKGFVRISSEKKV